MEQNEQQQRRALEVVEATPALVKLTPEAIEVVKENINLCENLVSQVLEKDIDWGPMPGVPTPFLWDPGASKIMAAFNCYPSRKILSKTEEDKLISFTIETNLVSRQTHQVIGSGLAACSSRETKYKYRWVVRDEALHQGISIEEVDKLKKRDSKYRIPNPEYGELVNNIARMAAKRSEVDAVESLPGVSSALRKLFKGIPVKTERHKVSPREHTPEKPEKQAKRKRPIEGGWAEPKTFNDLYKICFDLYKLQPVDVLRELGVSSQMDLTITPVEALQTISAVYKDVEGTNLFEDDQDAEQIP